MKLVLTAALAALPAFAATVVERNFPVALEGSSRYLWTYLPGAQVVSFRTGQDGFADSESIQAISGTPFLLRLIVRDLESRAPWTGSLSKNARDKEIILRLRTPQPITSLRSRAMVAQPCTPTDSDQQALLKSGVIYLNAGALPLAKICFDLALKISPADPIALFNKGRAERDQPVAAAEAYRAALAVDPDFVEARFFLSQLAGSAGGESSQVELLMSIAGDSRNPLSMRHTALGTLVEIAEGRAHFDTKSVPLYLREQLALERHILAVNPDWTIPALHRFLITRTAESLEIAGDHDEALGLWEEAIKTSEEGLATWTALLGIARGQLAIGRSNTATCAQALKSTEYIEKKLRDQRDRPAVRALQDEACGNTTWAVESVRSNPPSSSQLQWNASAILARAGDFISASALRRQSVVNSKGR
jgi:tetratricopeptide (TPR) repeat protein